MALRRLVLWGWLLVLALGAPGVAAQQPRPAPSDWEAQLSEIEKTGGEGQIFELYLLIGAYSASGTASERQQLFERADAFLVRHAGPKDTRRLIALPGLIKVHVERRQWTKALDRMTQAMTVVEAASGTSLDGELSTLSDAFDTFDAGLNNDKSRLAEERRTLETRASALRSRQIALIEAQGKQLNQGLAGLGSADAAAIALEQLIERLNASLEGGKITDALATAEQALDIGAKHVGERFETSVEQISKALDEAPSAARKASGSVDERAALVANARSLQQRAATTLDNLFLARLAAAERQSPTDAQMLISVLKSVAAHFDNDSASEYKPTAADRSSIAKAIPFRRRILELVENDAAPPLDIVGALISLAAALDGASEAASPEAERLLRRALTLHERTVGREVEALKYSLIAVANYHVRNKQFAAAIMIRERMASIDASDPDMAKATDYELEELIRLAEAAGDGDRKRAYEVQLAAKKAKAAGDALAALEVAVKAAEAAAPQDQAALLSALDDLASHHEHEYGQSGYARAVVVRERMLAILETRHGPDSLDLMTALEKLGEAYDGAERSDTAQRLYQRMLAIVETKRDEPERQLEVLSKLANTLKKRRRHTELLVIYRRTVDVLEAIPAGQEHRGLDQLGDAYRKLAEQLLDLNRAGEAAPVLQRWIKLAAQTPEAAGGGSIENPVLLLASVYTTLGNPAEAETQVVRALQLKTKRLGAGHHELAPIMLQLARLRRQNGDFASAQSLAREALRIIEQAHKSDLIQGESGLFGVSAEKIHQQRAGSALAELAAVADLQGRPDEAVTHYQDALRHLNDGQHFFDFAELLQATILSGRLYIRLGRFDKVEREVYAPFFKTDRPFPLLDSERGRVDFAQRRWRQAAERFAGVIDFPLEGPIADLISPEMLERAGLSLRDPRWQGGFPMFGQVERYGYIQAIYRELGDRPVTAQQPEMAAIFRYAAATSSSEAGAALAKLAERAAARDPKLAALVRERQDLVVTRTARVRANNANGGQASELAELDRRIAAADGEIDKFPDYVALIRPKPLDLETTQKLLGENESLMLIISAPALQPLEPETYVLAVTRTIARVVRSPLSSAEIQAHVAALRCGLDATAWRGDGEARCQTMLGVTLTRAEIEANEKLSSDQRKPLPYDLHRAAALYDALFGGVEDLLKTPTGDWRPLLVAPSGPLFSLPLQVLVTGPAPVKFAKSADDFRQVRWLGARQAITVLPAVSSLASLRRDPKASAAQKPYIGFGNPLLTGTSNKPEAAQLRAWSAAWQSCAAADLQAVCSAGFPHATSGPPQGLNRVHPSQIRQWSPLPQNACELCYIGARLKDVDIIRDIYLGAAATETAVKRLGRLVSPAQRSSLQDYRIIHFATHGSVANLRLGLAEPGLILTPPEEGKQSEEDDGYLAASEVVSLHLDAEWVILSACNTAAGNEENGEALSGLGRAFLYAGARSLLVSNWEVYTNAAVELTTRTLQTLEAKRSLGRAEALRRAIADMIADAAAAADAPFRLQPAYWAAFSVVGEGGAPPAK